MSVSDDDLEDLRDLEAMPTVPAHVVEFCRRARLSLHQVRWCEWCGIVAYAIDHYQRSALDAVGFSGGLCPECKCPDGPA